VKATVDAKALAKAVTTVAPFVGRTGMLPSITMIRIQVTADSTIGFTGGDIDRFCRTSTHTTGLDTAPGVALAPAKFLANAVARLHGDVTVSLEDGDLYLVTSKAQLSMPTGPVDEYPRIVWPENDPVTIDGDTWDRIQRVTVSASTDLARPGLCRLYVADGTAWATDSYRGGLTDTPGLPTLNLPAASIRATGRNLDGDITLVADQHAATFADQHTTVWMRNLPDDGPRLANLVPPSTNWSFTCATEALLDAVAVVGTLPDDSKIATPLRLSVNVDDDLLEVASTVAQHVGAARATVDATIEGTWPDFVGVSPRYLVELVTATRSDQVTVAGVDNRKPMLINGGGLTQILMPVRIS